MKTIPSNDELDASTGLGATFLASASKRLHPQPRNL